jgi:hypothetical protein
VGSKKFVYWAFTPKAGGVGKCLHGSTFGSFGAKNLSDGRKFLCNINGNPNAPQANKLFFPNLHKVHNLYILIDFYLVL